MTQSEGVTPSPAESRAEAWQRRAATRGKVDFTMMYVAHDAFTRDLSRLSKAASQGRAFTAAARTRWTAFSTHLHLHHTAEDSALWPQLREAVSDPAEAAVLDAMADEHAGLDPQIDRVSAALEDARAAGLQEELLALSSGLVVHMRHEEEAALPLLEHRLGAPGWKAFTDEVRRANGGIRGAADYLPWVLDGAAEDVQRSVLRMLPLPARMLYRRVWEPGYHRTERLT